MKWFDVPKGHQLAVNISVQTNFRPDKDINVDFIRLETNGLLTIYKGYFWDGVSGPTFDTLNLRKSSIVHDALYQLMRLGKLDRRDWRKADEMFRRCALSDGTWVIRVWWLMKGLELAKGKHTSPKKKKAMQGYP